ncbi:short-chain dehydrogenase [Marinobacter lutaoensis]|uniref:Short-chain dehydrogenase n=1 Tax=Marinobacter lutaoensis TaxID=135739 RepID=A0A1V2DXS9_9GAMM|nr:SDR family oxidoreductase [Marinobacter lutaoensis]ONF45220.1 short-chain dehydrogenase [Marinobacter lutaoensis]
MKRQQQGRGEAAVSNNIFITGAGAGIGRETARLFAARGWSVGAADRDEAALAGLRSELPDGACQTYPLDVTDGPSVAAALADFAGQFEGRLQVLHNNAGILHVGPFETLDLAAHRATVEVNVIGAMTVLHAAFAYLKDTPGAVVVNMSSASAIYGIPDFASYSASKHAVRALTEALDIEWEPYDIRVCDLMPPFVNTSMVQANTGGSPLFERLGIRLGPEQVAEQVWAQVQEPRLHRPITGQFRALWSVARSAPSSVTRSVIKRLRSV